VLSWDDEVQGLVWDWSGENPDHWMLLWSNDQFMGYQPEVTVTGEQRGYAEGWPGWWKVRGLNALSDPVTDDSNAVAVEAD
jgi:hypothetical protein